VLIGIELPPEGLAEILRLATDALQVVEVGSWNLLKYDAQMRHGHGRETVVRARMVQMPEEEAHHLAAFGETFLPLGRGGGPLFVLGKKIAD